MAPLSRQLRFHLPASRFTFQMANIGAELLSMFEYLNLAKRKRTKNSLVGKQKQNSTVVCSVKKILMHIGNTVSLSFHSIHPSKHNYLSSNQQQPFYSLPQCGAFRLEERLGAGPGVVRKRFLHEGFTAGFPRQQRLHGGQHTILQLIHRHQREADVGEELSGMDGALRTLTEPLQGGLKERLLALMLNLVRK